MRPPPWTCLGRALALALVAAGSSSAQGDDAMDAVWNAVVIEHELSGMLEFCSDLLGAHVEYERQAIEGAVPLRHQPGTPAGSFEIGTRHRGS